MAWRKSATPSPERAEMGMQAANSCSARYCSISGSKGPLLPLTEQYRALHEFAACIPISARSGDGVADLRQAIIERLPEGLAYFPADHITDQPERFLAAELIREKILQATREEVPHSVAVAVDSWEDTPKLIRIYATIYVERNGQKGIIIGAGGA